MPDPSLKTGPTVLREDERPLAGLMVLDFSQFLAGPSAALRLADLGARVIKVERPEIGELGRRLYISNLELDGDSTLFHSINRNKESFGADLKNADDVDQVRRLISKADVMIQNFRPGVIERLGLGHDAVNALNPRLIYGTVTGYGSTGPWRDKPGQDLLAQSLSGITWLSGNADQGPVPFGLAIADLMAGAHLAQGILACLVRRGINGKGGLVEVSLLESVLDVQFEVVTTHLSDGGNNPHRSERNNAHAYLSAPYGIYRTTDGYLAISMTPIPRLGELVGCKPLLDWPDPQSWFTERDEIKAVLAEHLQSHPTAHWLNILEPADIWCADVLTWPRLMELGAFKALHMIQAVKRDNGASLRTTRCPIRIDGGILTSDKAAPRAGEQTEVIRTQFGLTASN